MTISIPDNLPQPRIVTRLVLDELPRGQITRVRVEMVHDGLGRPMTVPVLVARGERPGPVFGITAAVHGNELNGIPVIHRLFEELQPRQLRGSIVAVVVANVPGLLLEQRQFNDGTDLNHIMPGDPHGNAAQIYAHRLLERIVRNFDYLVDLHTASFGRVNSLYVRADMNNATASRMARLLRPQIIVHNPPSDHTLRGAAEDHQIPAITTEIGNPQRFQGDYIRRALVGLRAVLCDLGLLGRRPTMTGSPPVICSQSYWLYTDHGGLLEVFPDVTDRVGRGDVIARLSNAFGDVVREYRSPETGIVIGKNVNPVAQTGARILHLGLIVSESEDELTVPDGQRY